jgi:hypothetical protein
MFRPRILPFCFVLCAALACKPEAATPPNSSAAAGAKPVPAARADNCPTRVPATAVTVLNTKDGVAMYFTTLGSYVTEVRRRTAALAQAVVPQPATAPADDRENQDVPHWEIVGQAGLVPVHVTAEDIAEGSRLLLVPLDADDLDTLRSYARAEGGRMSLGNCRLDFLKERSKAAS